MRLLHAKTKTIHNFEEDNAPKYAILSHTWNDGEVLFQDLEDLSKASKKAGFAKIRFCCDQALKDGFDYVWIDTCCIDKTSSTELSEAINSMYRWYMKARICYAYLSDVTEDGDNPMDIKSSRWFTRAWTLQELLAPRKLVFYSDEWRKIGTKITLQTAISEITAIEVEYLTQGNVHRASVAKRMCWAANREATRPEDIAYSIFGIFDIHMPLLYGEGLEKAFGRLQEEIMKYSNDHTLFAWRPLDTESKDEDENNQSYLADGQVQSSHNHRRSSYRSSALASSPAEFFYSDKYIPVNERGPAAPYRMTNFGLQISLPLDYDFSQSNSIRSKVPSIIWAALKCHKDDDFFHVLMLPLQHLGSNQFVRHPTKDLGLLPIKNLAKGAEQEIFIKDASDRQIVIDNPGLAFMIDKLSAEIKIVQVYPLELCEPEYMVLLGPRHSRAKKSWHTCLLLDVNLENRIQLVLLLGVHIRPEEEEKKEERKIAEGAFRDPRWVDNQTVEPWCALLEIRLDETLAQVYEEYRVPSEKSRLFCKKQRVEVKIETSVDIFGDTVCVVDIAVAKEE